MLPTFDATVAKVPTIKALWSLDINGKVSEARQRIIPVLLRNFNLRSHLIFQGLGQVPSLDRETYAVNHHIRRILYFIFISDESFDNSVGISHSVR